MAESNKQKLATSYILSFSGDELESGKADLCLIGTKSDGWNSELPKIVGYLESEEASTLLAMIQKGMLDDV